MTTLLAPAAAIRTAPIARRTRRFSFVPAFTPATSKLFHAWRP